MNSLSLDVTFIPGNSAGATKSLAAGIDGRAAGTNAEAIHRLTAKAIVNLQEQNDARKAGTLKFDPDAFATLVGTPTALNAPAWTAYTPTVTTTMTQSGVTKDAAYLQFGKLIALRIRVVVTLGGVNSALVSFSLPVNSKAGLTQSIHGSLEVGAASALLAFPVGATVDCYLLGGVNFVLGAHTFYIEGIYEAV